MKQQILFGEASYRAFLILYTARLFTPTLEHELVHSSCILKFCWLVTLYHETFSVGRLGGRLV